MSVNSSQTYQERLAQAQRDRADQQNELRKCVKTIENVSISEMILLAYNLVNVIIVRVGR